MALARFYDRVFAAAGRHLSVSRASLEATLGARVVAVRCGATCAEEGNARWIAELTTNLLARLYPRIALAADDATAEWLAGIARAINPAIAIEAVDSADVTVAIGGARAPAGALIPAAGGWVAHLLTDHDAVPTGPPNPYAAAAAAAFAAAEVFRRFFRDALPGGGLGRDVHVSLLDFTAAGGAELALPATDLGEVALVGLGAVGNAATWALARHPGIAGEAWLVDHEALDLMNLQRYVLATDADVARPKVEVVAQALGRTALRLQLRVGTLEDFAASFSGRFPVPTLAVSVDNVAGRRVAQALLPRVVVNGWTSDSGLGASWHAFARDAACLACLYQPTGVGPSQTGLVAEAFGLTLERATALWVSGQPPSGEELRGIATHLGVAEELLASWRGQPLPALYAGVVCGSVQLDLHGVGRVEAVPLAHQSVLAGVLMAAELVKRTDPALGLLGQRDGLVVWDDIRLPPPRRWTQPRPRVPHCICGDPIYQEAYAAKWGSSAPDSADVPPST